MKRRETQRQRIIEAALKVFAVRGLQGTKMSMIAEEAGLSAGQLYRFFESKEELFVTLIRQVAEETTRAMESIYNLPGSPFDKIRAFTASTLKEESAKYPFKMIQHVNTAEDAPEEAKQLIQQFSAKRYIEQLLPLFKEGQQTGDFAQGEPRRLISAFLTLLSALITFNMPIDDDHQMPDADILMRTIAGPRTQDR
ncbi:TetR/AcrR family transcriptional regulator [Paenibacillus sp. PR3]|uniref:TetR/AcrR family transcriptional regulator n=1 Tax=Paenibacillus terricola TaxID=2763503 RepID=A0ABR8MRD7_9BACL|nr:TetR/AcrR family transcriptional regulator [Paenibacillus terricola]MBD3917385.1 TetR/AcrR family transcriptional regulator [Paenibacillus terricola]